MGNDGPPPKIEGGYSGIGVVEVLWKVCSVVVNFSLKSGVVLHDDLHGSRVPYTDPCPMIYRTYGHP